MDDLFGTEYLEAASQDPVRFGGAGTVWQPGCIWDPSTQKMTCPKKTFV